MNGVRTRARADQRRRRGDWRRGAAWLCTLLVLLAAATVATVRTERGTARIDIARNVDAEVPHPQLAALATICPVVALCYALPASPPRLSARSASHAMPLAPHDDDIPETRNETVPFRPPRPVA